MPLTPLNSIYRPFKARSFGKINQDKYVKTTDDSSSVLSDATTVAPQEKPRPEKASAKQTPDSIDYGSTRYAMRGMSTRA
ncbi:uncharacterized protein BO80DRAFT_466926 [Aspergillus ibericus CBS 121593]|uniref:Uncharacterized protein n=1 Tax=Aspergillus ibericus CBS 121593 TaxID=1448316 RepID=A0A395GWP6_9EURO|nr:hypothetical protein BO80DRAFT_466926 [Aspergillus ibericus CBS 121593]RAK98483.1 hypothetical protein BO80DRAFT_466926 [Aspergillus ibericus CBS 121593]